MDPHSTKSDPDTACGAVLENNSGQFIYRRRVGKGLVVCSVCEGHEGFLGGILRVRIGESSLLNSRTLVLLCQGVIFCINRCHFLYLLQIFTDGKGVIVPFPFGEGTYGVITRLIPDAQGNQ